MSRNDTLPEYLKPLMDGQTIRLPFCAVCHRFHPLEQHHVVRRSAGKMFDEKGREIPKPTITLCGFGNNLKDADGNEYCHGLAHANRLHFRWVPEDWGHWEYIVLEKPTDYLTALDMDGWRTL